MNIETVVVGYLETNCYIVTDEAGEAAVIDPGGGVEKILSAVDRLGAKVRCILLTHTHPDHIGALDGVRRAHNVPVLVSLEEADFLRIPAGKRVGFDGGMLVEPVFNTFGDGAVVEFGSIKLGMMLTPGHTPGSACFYADGVLFSGDTLFNDGIGRTDFEGGSEVQIMRSLREKILLLPDGTRVLPGHGPATTIGVEKGLYM